MKQQNEKMWNDLKWKNSELEVFCKSLIKIFNQLIDRKTTD